VSVKVTLILKARHPFRVNGSLSYIRFPVASAAELGGQLSLSPLFLLTIEKKYSQKLNGPLCSTKLLVSRPLLHTSLHCETTDKRLVHCVVCPVSVEAKLSFVEAGRRWAHSPSPTKATGISYQGTMKTSVRM